MKENICQLGELLTGFRKSHLPMATFIHKKKEKKHHAASCGLLSSV